MAKKDLKQATERGAGVMDIIAQGGGRVMTAADQPPEKKAKYYGDREDIYRFSLNMPIEFEAYLKKAAFDASEPGHVVTITQYINGLIRDDMEKNNGGK